MLRAERLEEPSLDFFIRRIGLDSWWKLLDVTDVLLEPPEVTFDGHKRPFSILELHPSPHITSLGVSLTKCWRINLYNASCQLGLVWSDSLPTRF